MDRRDFVRAGIVSAAALGVPADADAAQQPRQFYELRAYELRNDLEPGRLATYMEQAYIPALNRAGVRQVGAFTPDFGMPSPSLLLLLPFPSLEAYGTLADRIAADPALRASRREFEAGGRVPYVRYDATLLRAFAGHPRVESAEGGAERPARLFELRTYEAPNTVGLANKVDMFDREEIELFRKVGMSPVFFGEALAGERLPHLTYMIAFPDMDARTRAWSAFGSHPDWARIRDRPGWTNREAVSSIRAAFLRPTRYSQIR